MKATQGKAKLSGDPKMAWVEDFSDGGVRGIGVLEVAGAAGLILPWALDIARALTPIAAVGVAVLMAGRGDHPPTPGRDRSHRSAAGARGGRRRDRHRPLRRPLSRRP